MRIPEELSEKTKEIFPEAAKLHEAIENRDVALVMGYLNEIITPMMNIMNDWFMVKLEASKSKYGDIEGNPQRSQGCAFKVA